MSNENDLHEAQYFAGILPRSYVYPKCHTCNQG